MQPIYLHTHTQKGDTLENRGTRTRNVGGGEDRLVLYPTTVPRKDALGSFTHAYIRKAHYVYMFVLYFRIRFF